MRVFSFLLILLAVSALVHWRWLIPGQTFAWGDFIYFMKSDTAWRELYRPPYLWDTAWGFGQGSYNALLFSYPLYSTIGALVKFGLPSYTAIKIFLFYPIIFFMPIGMFLLAFRVTRSAWGGLAASLTYCYNTYILLTQAGGLMHITGAYVFAPYLLLVLDRLFSTQKLKFAILAGLFGFVISTYEFRIFYIMAAMAIIYPLFNSQSLKKFFHNSAMLIVVFVIYAGLSAFWLAPFFLSGAAANNPAQDRGIFGDSYMYFTQSLYFFHPFWTGGQGPASGVVQPLPPQLVLLPVLAGLGLWFGRRNPRLWHFAVIAVVGVLLTKQSAPPFPGLYRWLYDHLPGFYAFRESSKFYLVTALGYSVLLGSFIAGLPRLIAVRLPALILISALFLPNTASLISGRIGTMFSPKIQSESSFRLNRFLSQQTDSFRTLWVPFYSFWDYYSVRHPSISLYDLFYQYQPQLSDTPGYLITPNKSHLLTDNQHQLLNFLSQPFSDSLLDQMGIKYVIVPAHPESAEDDVFVNFGLNDRPYALSYLESLPYLQKLDAGAADITVFVNQDYLPPFTLSSRLPSLGSRPQPVMKYQTLSPVSFQIEIPDLPAATYLNFSQNFHPSWELNLSKSHVKNDLLHNSFLISPAAAKKLTLTYTGQDSVYPSLLISTAAWLTVTLYLTNTLCRKSLS